MSRRRFTTRRFAYHASAEGQQENRRRFEGPLHSTGPAWRIELTSPRWPD